MIDLHVHSSHSDGTHKPEELLRLAALQEITLLALADHDCISGVDEAIAAGNNLGIRVIPAVELSVAFERYTDVHLLAYGINHLDPSFRERLSKFCARRDHRSEAIVERINRKLHRQGRSAISFAEVTALADGAIGRPHIARVLMEHGHVNSMEEAFNLYLIPCNVAKEYFPMDEAITEIHRLSGMAVLAHPTSITSDLPTLQRLICQLHGMGLDGVEAYSNMAGEAETAALIGTARRLGMAVTGGSDFHGITGDERLGIIRGETEIPSVLGEELLAALVDRQHKPV